MANRLIVAGLLAFVFSASRGLIAAEQERIALRVLDAADQRGFAEPGDIDSTKDIERAIKGSSKFRLVPNNADLLADYPRLMLSVRRSTEKTEELFPSYYEALKATVSVSTPPWQLNSQQAQEPLYFKFISKVGGSGRWRYAANEIVHDLEKWVEANRDRIKLK